MLYEVHSSLARSAIASYVGDNEEVLKATNEGI